MHKELRGSNSNNEAAATLLLVHNITLLTEEGWSQVLLSIIIPISLGMTVACLLKMQCLWKEVQPHAHEAGANMRRAHNPD